MSSSSVAHVLPLVGSISDGVETPAEVAGLLMTTVIQPVINECRPHNIPAIDLGCDVTVEVWNLIVEKCLRQNYEAAGTAVGDRPFRHVVAELTYIPRGADGDDFDRVH